MSTTRSPVDVLLSALLPWARALGFARGVAARGTPLAAPSALIEIFSLEGCGACRRVRNALTELGLDYIHRSCPIGDGRNRAVLAARSGHVSLPYLVDPNTGAEMGESQDIVRYLEATYGPERERAAGAPRTHPSAGLHR